MSPDMTTLYLYNAYDQTLGAMHYENGWHWFCQQCSARSKPNCAYDFASTCSKALLSHIEMKHSAKLKGK